MSAPPGLVTSERVSLEPLLFALAGPRAPLRTFGSARRDTGLVSDLPLAFVMRTLSRSGRRTAELPWRPLAAHKLRLMTEARNLCRSFAYASRPARHHYRRTHRRTALTLGQTDSFISSESRAGELCAETRGAKVEPVAVAFSE